MNYLVFRLYGPLASWGEIAVGEARHSAAYPSKSAICGLLGAALGIDRSEDARHQELAEGYLQAVKVVSAGHLLKDYHTAQAPDSVGKFRYRTRRDELVAGKDRLGTILSTREYRTDALAVVALRETPETPYPLQDLLHALREPVFHLYLGRKSCPLAAPLDPQLIDAASFRTALNAYQMKELLVNEPDWNGDQRWLKPDEIARYYWEGQPEDFASEDDAGYNASQLQKLVRHDKPSSRQRWQFQSRTEYLWLDQSKEAS